MTVSVYDASLEYVAAGLSVIPVDPNATKRPAYRILPVINESVEGWPRRSWAPFKSRQPTGVELHRWFGSWGCMSGIAVVCGNVSGGLEAIDVDSSEHAEPFLDCIREQVPDLLERLVLVQTPRPGLHCYYRCPAVGRNTHLAKMFVRNESGTGVDVKTIIETRGEGGYALIPPTPGYCHPTGRTYEYITPRTLADVPTLSAEERDRLFAIARCFDAIPPRQRPTPQPRPVTRNLDRRLPGNDFNARVDWAELLERHGWSLWHITPDGVQHWTRPGKADGTSATVDYNENGLLHVFTSNADPLEQDESYSKFFFVTLVEYGGDFREAARALQQQGYGQRTSEIGRRTRQRHGQGGERRRPRRSCRQRRS